MSRRRKTETHESNFVEKHWTLDKRVPVSMLFAIVLQTGSMIWWASGANRDIQQLGKNYESLSVVVKEQGTRLERVGTMDVELSNVKSELRRLNTNLEKVVDRLASWTQPPVMSNRSR